MVVNNGYYITYIMYSALREPKGLHNTSYISNLLVGHIGLVINL